MPSSGFRGCSRSLLLLALAVAPACDGADRGRPQPPGESASPAPVAARNPLLGCYRQLMNGPADLVVEHGADGYVVRDSLAGEWEVVAYPRPAAADDLAEFFGRDAGSVEHGLIGRTTPGSASERIGIFKLPANTVLRRPFLGPDSMVVRTGYLITDFEQSVSELWPADC